MARVHPADDGQPVRDSENHLGHGLLDMPRWRGAGEIQWTRMSGARDRPVAPLRPYGSVGSDIVDPRWTMVMLSSREATQPAGTLDRRHRRG